ncbi:hypothetical protein ACM39_07155 [Chryseobacterium sp. FH2]|uniref:DUF4280 domain-containing protein n=1 Tax=Chryseobacterium sp. FH2 TaxID=1674291 RepID=UPI00065AFF61|nr:DUF4280 domain-containing protein [Chryseobacterium sp. FH2]KMQ69043.1 hypothetical protein ACM39_07155 [Chryseobacterium sp. FH2]
MPQKLTEKALLLCDKGAKPSQLKVTSQTFSKADEKLIATEQDKQAETNIPNFGACAVTHGQCTPAVVKWNKTTEKDTINNFKILTDESTCQCSVGGKISVQDKGHTEKHEVYK